MSDRARMSTDVWFTSDTHFGHEKIIGLESSARPFASVEEHDEALIERWNARVKPADTIWHLGDFAFKPATTIDRVAPRLNGRKRLAMGNHDQKTAALLRHFQRVFGADFIDLGGHRVLLSHIPAHPCQLTRCVAVLHGHLHTDFARQPDGERDPRYINLCVEHWDLAPVHLEEILPLISQVAS